ncbi:MAG TPA: archaeosortase A [Candidatus Thermoplasmatota archaeon]|nr:archaeosortase A [Candidatus Thermoplasmatota archaeon]
MADALAILVNGCLGLGLALLFAGFLHKGRASHVLRGAGWLSFGAYWPFQAGHYFEINDPVNAWFTILGPGILVYFAWHERMSWKWQEDPPALRWLAGTTFVAASVYFAFLVFPALAAAAIRLTAIQTVWMLKGLFRLDAETAPDLDGVDTHILLITPTGVQDYAVTIILACTAIQSMMIFGGAIGTVEASTRRKWLAALATIPAIHVLNIFRNAGIVFGYKILDWSMFGIESFEWMHSYVGKFGSLAALVVLALVLFRILPELHGNILDVFDLPKRKGPGFYRPPGEKAQAPPPDTPAA